MHAVGSWRTKCLACGGSLVLLLSEPNIVKTGKSEQSIEKRVQKYIEGAKEDLDRQKEDGRKEYV
tara:strand:- start:1725 stop:1919 length:195 start_codon:yes stop_codon:yes gene_type:complete